MLFVNYGKKNLSKRKNQISSKKRMKTKRVGVRFSKALILCILLLAVICIIGGIILIKHIIDDTPYVTAEDMLPKGYTMVLGFTDAQVTPRNAGLAGAEETMDWMFY